MNKFAAIIAIALVSLAVAPAANAGGVCGSGGFFRGTLGELCDKHIEKPITTPFARQMVMTGSQAIGTFYGGPIGGIAGGIVGQGVNDAFAGRFGGGSNGGPGPQLGNFCHTPQGRFGPGPVNPLGSFCSVNTQWGTIPGQVGQ